MAARGWEAERWPKSPVSSASALCTNVFERLMRGHQATGGKQKRSGHSGVPRPARGSDRRRAVCRTHGARALHRRYVARWRGFPVSRSGYTISEPIGTGDSGAVYRATQPGLERDVARRMIPPELASSRAFIQRFEVEAQFVRAARASQHRAAVRLLARPERRLPRLPPVAGAQRGGSAGDAWAIDPRAVSTVVNQIGAPVAAAHFRGFAHRDVKPARILFDEVDIVYLSDFGIARIDGRT